MEDAPGDEAMLANKLRLSLSPYKFLGSATVPSPRRSSRIATILMRKSPDVDSEDGTSQTRVSSNVFDRNDTMPSVKDEVVIADISEITSRRVKQRNQASTTPEDDCRSKPASLKRVNRTSSKSPYKKPMRGYAPPETYAHLNPLSDYLAEDLDVLFCGINPGQMSAQVGHHFANPTNHFWRCLFGSGFTDRLLPAAEDHTLPEKYSLGLTNLVDRPSAEAGELAGSEFTGGVPTLLEKIALYRPRVLCFVGKGIWTSFQRAVTIEEAFQNSPPAASETTLTSGAAQSTTEQADDTPNGVRVKRTTRKTRMKVTKRRAPIVGYGLQPYKIIHDATAAKETLFFVMPSTSGRVTTHQLPEKTALMKALKGLVEDHKKGSLNTTSMAVITTPK